MRGAVTKDEAVLRTGELFDGLHAVLVAWDPYRLAQTGGPNEFDEFSDEAWAVLRRLPDTRTTADVAALIAEVFDHSFAAPEAWGEVGARVHAWWLSQH